MYKVFINEHLLFFSKKLESNQQYLNKKIVKNPNKTEYIAIVNDLFGQKEKQLVQIHTNDDKEAFSLFCNSFQMIKAAGGFVKNNEGLLLFIYRLGKWDLPKGKVEEGESVEEAAIREVEEECGLKGLEIEHKVANTYHIDRKSVV